MVDRIDYILAIAEEGNLTRAAKRLYITQPALTKYVNNLEAKYNIQLFDRRANPVVLTPAGKLFLDEKMKINIAEQNLRQKLDSLKNKRQTISIGAGYAYAERRLPGILRDFLPLHPDLDVRIQCAGELELPELLQRGKIDIAIGAFSFDDVGYANFPLFYGRLCLIIPLKFGIFPPDFDALDSFEHPYLLHPDALNDLDFVMPDKGLGSYENYSAFAHLYSIRNRRLIQANSASAIRQLVQNGLGYSYSAISSKEQLYSPNGELSIGCATLPGLPAIRTSHLVYPLQHPNTKLVQALGNAILERYRQ